MNSDTILYISIYYRNWILLYQSLLSAGEGTNFSHSRSAASTCLSPPHCPCLQWLLFLSSVKTVQSTPSATKGALMDNLIPNTEMIRGAGRLYYSQREAEQAKVVLQVWNLPKTAMWKAHGGESSTEVSNAERNWWLRGKEKLLGMGAVQPLNPSLQNRSNKTWGGCSVNESNKSGHAFNYTHYCWTKRGVNNFPHRRKDTISLKLSWSQRLSVLLFFSTLGSTCCSPPCIVGGKGLIRSCRGAVLQQTVFSLTDSADWKVPSCWAVHS